MARSPSPEKTLEIFFDGDCPLCLREIAYVRKLDRKKKIVFTDIASPSFDAEQATGRDLDKLMASMHARLPGGQIVDGVEAFRQMYSRVGWGPLVRISRWPLIRPVLDRAYALFARNRPRLTGRCAEHKDCRSSDSAPSPPDTNL